MPTVWSRARDLRDEAQLLSLDARHKGQKALSEAMDRVYKELCHPAVDAYDPENKS